MKHKFITISFLILFFNLSYSQNNVDSLTIELKNCKKDTAKIAILNELAMNLYNTNPTLCFEYASLAQKITEKENYKTHYTQTLNALAVANWALGKYDKSLEYLFEKLKIHQQKKDSQKIASTYRNIAIIYNETGRNELALDNLFKALEINEHDNYEIGIAEVCNLIGVTYNRIDSIAKAKKYWLLAIKLYTKNDQILRIAYVKNNLGSIYKKINQLDSALIYFNESLVVCKKFDDNWSISQILKNIADIYMEKNKISLAENYYIKALNTAKTHNLLNKEIEILFSITQLDTLKKDYKSAFENYTQYVLLKDSIFSQEQDNTISELQIKYETEKKEQENQLLKKSDKIKSSIGVTISIVLILLIILLIFLWRLIRTKQKTNKILSIKNNEITEQNTIINEQKKALQKQSEVLFIHKNHLEEIVKERTNELLKEKEKAEEGYKLKTAFLNNISHEFRTPLNGIIGFSSFLTKEHLPSEKRNKYANIVNRSCRQLLNIVSDTIDISKIQSEQTSIDFSNVNVEKIITDTLNLLEFEINQKGLQVETVNYPTDNMAIITDNAKFKKIIFHLIDNAVKFTHKGKIIIKNTITEKKFEFRIQDTGIGISEKEQTIIFDPFRQIETGATRFFGGNGLGLSIVKKYIEKLDGKIELISEINKGTTVNFTIPSKQENNIPTNILLQKKGNITEQTTILIAEDNEMNFLLLKEALNKYKCKILHARTGKETIELLKFNSQTDIILMDLKMPIMSGLEATKQIRESNDKIPIIAQTAYSENRKSLKSKGFNDLITKPIKITELINKIKQLL